jgi:chloramphenicol 3-O-phosphotransferase
MLLILSGPIGAGKTAVARELMRDARPGTAYLEGDAFWKFIVEPMPGQQPFKVMAMSMRAMISAARQYDRDGYDVLVDFTVPASYLNAVGRLLRGATFNYVVLRPSLETCAARAAARKRGKIDDYARYSDFYYDFETEERLTIDNEHVSASEAAKLIRAGVANGAFAVVPA